MSRETHNVSSDPSILIIFGITGDLARRKLLPALYHLAHDGLLPKHTQIVGVTRRDLHTDDLIRDIEAAVADSGAQCTQDVLKNLRKNISVVRMDVTKPDDFQKLRSTLDQLEDSVGMCLHRLFYLSIPSDIFQHVVTQLGEHRLNTGCQHGETESRILVEKPFGTDLHSAKDLITSMRNAFSEQQTYRIDHYLAKETVQNILRFRFENPLFSQSWDKHHISHIMITAAESIGIEDRVEFYENTGALRDLVQSHLLQILTLITMDKPTDLTSAQAIHEQKQTLLASVQPPSAEQMGTHTVRGQYDSYKTEVDNPSSTTETYAAVRLYIDSDTWRGVPIFVRSGKSLREKLTEVSVVLTDPDDRSCTNTLTIRIQPHEGIVLDLRIKKPGFDVDGIEHTQMSFCYADDISATHPDAYERVLIDVMRGNKTLFATSSEVLDSWRIIDPIMNAWRKNETPLETYAAGTWGPQSADTMARKQGAEWLSGTPYVCTVHLGQQ